MTTELLSASANPSSSEDDDARLASRSHDLVYAAAVRQTRGDLHTAADVMQIVMLVMLDKARRHRLPEERFMNGWLLNVTRYAAMQVRRAAATRMRHESRAAPLAVSEAQKHEVEFLIREELDAAILTLNRYDREVVIRRYLRGETVAEVAAVLAVSENTAGRRATRALEKLRKILESRGVTAPADILSTALATEFAVKAPAACAALTMGNPIAGRAVRTVAFRMAVHKVSLAFGIGCVVLATASIALAAAIQLRGGTLLPFVTPISTAPAALDPQPIRIVVDKVLDGPSDAILKQILEGLIKIQFTLKTIHVVGATTSWSSDMRQTAWLRPVHTEGQSWAEAADPRRVRDEVKLGRQYVMEDGIGLHPDVLKSYVEAWDGKALDRLFGPPLSTASGETFETRYLHGGSILGSQFSMQLPWDEEARVDASGTHKTFDRYPLSAVVLAQMQLTARQVQLAGNVDAMELRVVIPDPSIQRVETFWFDPNRGFGLLAREDTVSVRGRLLRRIDRRIDQLAEASPGVFYPSKAMMFWEEQGKPFESEQFEASRVTANEPMDAGSFHIEFPAGIPIYDFIDGLGKKRSAN